MKILFYTSQIDVRGTCTAIWDYAHYNETLLGNTSTILTIKDNPGTESIAFDKFKNRFQIVYVDESNYEEYDVVYLIKYGKNDRCLFPNVKNVVHCVFDMSEPHGDVYAGVSEAVARKFGKTLFVPHMVGLKPSTTKENWRARLSIPDDAIVFGRHGGKDTFDIDFVKLTIRAVVCNNPNIYFVFVNTPSFASHPNVIFLDAIISDDDKNAFINTCDACIHAQSLGETFGLSLGEFSVNNKPIITYGGETWNSAHKDILKDKATYYFDAVGLYNILTDFTRPPPDAQLNCYTDFTPEKVMATFEEVFLK